MTKPFAAAAFFGIVTLVAGSDAAVAAAHCQAQQARLEQIRAGGRLVAAAESQALYQLLKCRKNGGATQARPAAKTRQIITRRVQVAPGFRVLTGRTASLGRQDGAAVLRHARRESTSRDWDGALPVARNGRTYRTWCVRSCDGYYFPVSFSTTRQYFAADQEACQRMCPGTEVELFHHAANGQGREDMISISGTPYASLPSAFSYRTSLDQSCTCGRSGGAPVTFDARVGGSSAEEAETAAVPKARPAPGDDPETVANRRGDFRPGVETRTRLALASHDPAKPRQIIGTIGRSPPLLSPVPSTGEGGKAVSLAPLLLFAPALWPVPLL